MKIKLIRLIFLLLTISSCKENTSTNKNVINDENKTLIFDHLQSKPLQLQVEKLIPLETIESNFLSDNLTVKYTSDYIFIFDEQIRDGIHQFDHKGRYLSQIITTGEGPEQINNISDFIVSEKTLELLSGKGDYSEIISYSIAEKKIISTLKLEIIGFSFTKMEDVYYIYSSYNYPFSEFRISKVDYQGNILERYLKNDYTGTMLPVVERNLFTNIGKTFLLESFNNTIYEVTPQRITSKYTIDFGRYNISNRFFEEDLIIAFEKLNNEGFFSILTHFEGSNLAFSNLIFQKENSSQPYLILYNKGNQEIIKYKLEDPWAEVLKYPVGLTEDDQAIFSINPQYLLKNTALLKLNGNTEIEVDGNPVLVYIKFLN